VRAPTRKTRAESTRTNNENAQLIKAVVRARGWFGDLLTGRVRSYEEIAKREGVTKRYVGHLMPLAFLAREIVMGILAGNQPIEFTAERVTKRTDLPLGWSDQKQALRFDSLFQRK
jgi:hypothetical protein